MKKISILLLSALTLGIATTSCSKNEEETATIVAKWTFVDSTHTKSGATSAAEPYNPTCSNKSYLNLKADGLLEQQAVGVDEKEPCGIKKTDGTYSYQNNTLRLNSGGYVMDYQVVSMTPSKLTLKFVFPMDDSQYFTFNLVKK